MGHVDEAGHRWNGYTALCSRLPNSLNVRDQHRRLRVIETFFSIIVLPLVSARFLRMAMSLLALLPRKNEQAIPRYESIGGFLWCL